MSRCTAIANVVRNGPLPIDVPGISDYTPFGPCDISTPEGRARLDIIPAIHARVTEWNALITASFSMLGPGTEEGTGSIVGESAPLYSQFYNIDNSAAADASEERSLGLTGVMFRPIPNDSLNPGTSGMGTCHAEPSGTDGTLTASLSLAPFIYFSNGDWQNGLHWRDGNTWWPNLTFGIVISPSVGSHDAYFSTNRFGDVEGHIVGGTLTIRIPNTHVGGNSTQDFTCPLWTPIAPLGATYANFCDVLLTPSACFSYSGIWNNSGQALVNPITLL